MGEKKVGFLDINLILLTNNNPIETIDEKS